MGHFAMLAPHEQLVETLLYVGQVPFYQRFMELSLDRWTAGGPPGHRWESLHKLTQGLKDSFWGSVRGKFSVNDKMNDFVWNILQSKFYACCYIFLPGARHKRRYIHTYLLLSYLRCHWCRSLAIDPAQDLG